MIDEAELRRMPPRERRELARRLAAIDGPSQAGIQAGIQAGMTSDPSERDEPYRPEGLNRADGLKIPGRLNTPGRLKTPDRPGAAGGPSQERDALSGERRLVLLLITGCCVILAGWTVILHDTLPRNFDVNRWRGLWVGFDIFLTAAFYATAKAAWWERLSLIPALTIVGTMLCCDAWFDVETAIGTSTLWISIASAAFLELPLAFLAFAGAKRLLVAAVTADQPGASRAGLILGEMPLAGAGLDEALPRLRRKRPPGA